MADFVAWNSQPLELWAQQFARGKFVELDGHKTHYLEKGEGEPLILIHGFFYDSYMWQENMDTLAKHFKVYALDLWGSGYSTRQPLDYGYPLFARQLLLFMNALGIRKASLAGQSMGGGTAMQFCLHHRERVDRIILVNAAGLPNPLPPLAKFFNLPLIGEFFAGLKTNAIRKKGLSEVFIHKAELITDDYFENVTRAQKIAGSIRAGLQVTRKQFFDKLSDTIERLGKMSVPILIVWGREDKSIPVVRAYDMHRMLPGSRLEVFDEAGHVSNFECADRFNRLAFEFLQQRQGASEKLLNDTAQSVLS